MPRNRVKITAGTTVPAGEAAIITIDKMTGMSLVIPDLEADKPVSDLLIYLTAIMVRGLREPEFFASQVEWFKSNDKRNTGTS